MEIPVVLGPGGGRDVTSITSAVDVVIDLAAFSGVYVEITWDQPVFVSFIPPTGTYSLSPSGAVAMAKNPSEGAIVGKRVAAGDPFHRLVSPKWTRLIVRAQSTSATYTEVKIAQDGYGV